MALPFEIKDINWNEKRRKKLISLLKTSSKSCDGKDFIDSIANSNCTLLIPNSVTYCYYPFCKGHPKNKEFLQNKEIHNLLDNLPILKQFLRKNQSNHSIKRPKLEFNCITSFTRLEMINTTFFLLTY